MTENLVWSPGRPKRFRLPGVLSVQTLSPVDTVADQPTNRLLRSHHCRAYGGRPASPLRENLGRDRHWHRASLTHGNPRRPGDQSRRQRSAARRRHDHICSATPVHNPPIERAIGESTERFVTAAPKAMQGLAVSEGRTRTFKSAATDTSGHGRRSVSLPLSSDSASRLPAGPLCADRHPTRTTGSRRPAAPLRFLGKALAQRNLVDQFASAISSSSGRDKATALVSLASHQLPVAQEIILHVRLTRALDSRTGMRNVFALPRVKLTFPKASEQDCPESR